MSSLQLELRKFEAEPTLEAKEKLAQAIDSFRYQGYITENTANDLMNYLDRIFLRSILTNQQYKELLEGKDIYFVDTKLPRG